VAYTVTANLGTSSNTVLRFFEISPTGTIVQTLAALGTGLSSAPTIAPSTPASTSLLVLCISANDGTAPGTTFTSVTDGSHTWTQAEISQNSSEKVSAAIFYTYQGNSGALDKVATVTPASSTAVSSGTTATTTTAIEFCVAVAGWAGASTVTLGSLTGLTSNEAQGTSTGSDTINQECGYQFVTSKSTYSWGGTLSATEQHACCIATFPYPSGGAADSGTGAIHFAGSGTATVIVPDSGTGAIHFAGSGTATVIVPDSGTGHVAFHGSGAALLKIPDTGLGHVTFGGSGTPLVKVPATGTGAIAFHGSGTASAGGQAVPGYLIPNDLSAWATLIDIAPRAVLADLSSYAELSDLSSYVETKDVAPYVVCSDFT
jgi:hypothetical protein